MHSSRPFTTASPSIAVGSCTTATEAAQYVSIKYTERLAQAGIEPSVGSVSDAYGNVNRAGIAGDRLS
jgi:hypothetical protein